MENNPEFINNIIKKFLLLLIVLVTSACGGNNSSTAPVDSSGLGGGTDNGGGTTVTVGTVTMTADPSTVSVSNASTVTATVQDTDGNNVPDATVVTFSLDDSALGSLSASTASTTNGQATVTFTASTTNAGTAVLTATAGGFSDTVSITVTGAVGSVSVSANPITVTVNGTSSVSVAVLDTDSNNVSDGTPVSFSVTDSDLGSITSTSTTYNGIATAAFTAASDKAGLVTITASVGGVNDSVSITVNGAEAGSIAFESAAPSVVGIRGTGQNEVSTIKFTVLDINGNPVLDGAAVDVCLLVHPSGNAGLTGVLPDNGGEYINEADDVIETWLDDPSDGGNGNGCYDTGETYIESNGNGVYDSPFHATVSTVSGEATIFLHSGLVAGNVSLLATVVDPGMSSATAVLSIGGGIPDMNHFTIATEKLNLPGLERTNWTSEISVYIADRYGNTNVLAGTTVSFYAESGALKSSDILDAEGTTMVNFRTQEPIPYDVVPSVLPGLDEPALLARVETEYGIPIPCSFSIDPSCVEPAYPAGNPRDGWATLTVGIIGQEKFDDCNGNGVYDVDADCDDDGILDGPERYYDTQDEVFVDYNDNDTCEDNETSVDPLELYEDLNGDGVWNGLNAQWDASKTLFKDIKLLITGSPLYRRLSAENQITDCTAGTTTSGYTPVPNGFTICNGEARFFKLFVSDKNLNAIISDSSIKITATKGTLEGMTDITMPDVFGTGTELGFILADTDATDTDLPELVIIEITVTWDSIEYIDTIYGSID